jgi:hypothetical protein
VDLLGRSSEPVRLTQDDDGTATVAVSLETNRLDVRPFRALIPAALIADSSGNQALSDIARRVGVAAAHQKKNLIPGADDPF